jgi:hypothetical protein
MEQLKQQANKLTLQKSTAGMLAWALHNMWHVLQGPQLS